MLKPPYRPFGFLRLVLAAVVVLGHASWLAPDDLVAQAMSASKAAGAAVLAFFVLSGFVLTEAAASLYRHRPAAFVANRFLKIVPAYMAALVLSLAAHAVLASQGLVLKGIEFEGYKSLPQQMWSWLNALYNPLAVVPFLYLDTASHLLGNGLYLFVRYIWAVNVEVLFYVTVLTAIMLVSRGWRMTDRSIAAVVATVAVLHIALSIAGKLNFILRSPRTSCLALSSGMSRVSAMFGPCPALCCWLCRSGSMRPSFVPDTVRSSCSLALLLFRHLRMLRWPLPGGIWTGNSAISLFALSQPLRRSGAVQRLCFRTQHGSVAGRVRHISLACLRHAAGGRASLRQVTRFTPRPFLDARHARAGDAK